MVVIADGETHSTQAPVAAGTSNQYPVNGTVATGHHQILFVISFHACTSC
jgi:hypothetical protein